MQQVTSLGKRLDAGPLGAWSPKSQENLAWFKSLISLKTKRMISSPEIMDHEKDHYTRTPPQIYKTGNSKCEVLEAVNRSLVNLA